MAGKESIGEDFHNFEDSPYTTSQKDLIPLKDALRHRFEFENLIELGKIGLSLDMISLLRDEVDEEDG